MIQHVVENEFEVEHRRRTDIATVELMAALQAAGIRSILLKGPSVQRWLYADHETRHYWDIDLLVSPAELHRAEAVADSLGFEPLSSESMRILQESHHEKWYRPPRQRLRRAAPWLPRNPGER